MTADELRLYFNDILSRGGDPDGLPRSLPSIYEVDHETYANVCQYIFDKKADEVNQHIIHIALGLNKGIMFKGVELILIKT